MNNVKKKKSIIFCSNPHNSSLPAGAKKIMLEQKLERIPEPKNESIQDFKLERISEAKPESIPEPMLEAKPKQIPGPKPLKKLVLGNYEIKDGCYMKDDVKMTNFTLAVKKIVKEDGEADYEFEVDINGQKVSRVWTSTQICRQRFLQKLSVFIEDEAEFYKLLRRAVFETAFSESDVVFQVNDNGLQQVNGKMMYVYTNGSIGKDGFHPEVYSGIEGMYLPAEAVVDVEQNKVIIERLFREYDSNPEVFYPLFLTNLMAITSGYFDKIGESDFMKLTLWLDGKSGSGKTELSKAVGTYTFSGKELNKRLVSVTGKRRYALRCLSNSSGGVCILDDVKNESVRERRNSVKIIVDDYIRSVFQGALTDPDNVNSTPKSINLCAIITGEYFETEESQNARMLYMKVSGFLKENRNSKALRVLQKNPMWFTTVCTGYIQWLLAMMEEISFSQLLINKLEEMRDRPKLYGGINNAERLIESRYMIEMAAILAKMYFEYIHMPEDFISSFVSNVTKSIQNVCDNTYFILGGEEILVQQAAEKVFSDCKIRKATYYKCCYGEYEYYQQYFWLNENDDFVWIDDYGKSLIKRCKEENSKYDGQSCLLISEQRFLELLKDQIETLAEDNQISSEIVDKVLIDLLKELRKKQIIYKQHRVDNPLGRAAVKYPMYRKYYEQCATRITNYYDDDYNGYYDDYNDYDDDTHGLKIVLRLNCESVIQINIAHPCASKLRERMEELDMSESQDQDIKDARIDDMSEEEAYKLRKSFVTGKILHRE